MSFVPVISSFTNDKILGSLVMRLENNQKLHVKNWQKDEYNPKDNQYPGYNRWLKHLIPIY